MKAVAFKDNKPVKTWFHVIKVSPDQKYRYFIITEKLYHHELISTIRFIESDKIVTYEDRKVVATYYAVYWWIK